jgi:hypothetical protein
VLSQTAFNALESKDINLYFQSTYLRYKRLDTDKPVWKWGRMEGVGSASDGGWTLEVACADKNDPYILSTNPKLSEIEFPVAEVGNYNFKGGVVTVSRKFARQNRKGLCHETVRVDELLGANLKIPAKLIASMSEFKWTPQNVALLFGEGQQAISLEDSLEQIGKEQVLARILDERLSVSQGIFSKNPTIWFRNIPVAELNVKKFVAEIMLPYFRQELVLGLEKHAIPVKD